MKRMLLSYVISFVLTPFCSTFLVEGSKSIDIAPLLTDVNWERVPFFVGIVCKRRLNFFHLNGCEKQQWKNHSCRHDFETS